MNQVDGEIPLKRKRPQGRGKRLSLKSTLSNAFSESAEISSHLGDGDGNDSVPSVPELGAFSG